MANLFWTIIPFVLTFTVAAWAPQEQELQKAPARSNRNTSPCLG